jgi:hypothetical protein
MQEDHSMDVAQVLGRIEALMDEEGRLRRQGEAEHRLAEVKAALARQRARPKRLPHGLIVIS